MPTLHSSSLSSKPHKQTDSLELWNIWSHDSTARANPTFKQAIQAFSNITTLEMYLRRGKKHRDIRPTEAIHFAIMQFKQARSALRELDAWTPSFDRRCRMHVQYISGLLCDSGDMCFAQH
jgi:hypothetical protein